MRRTVPLMKAILRIGVRELDLVTSNVADQ